MWPLAFVVLITLVAVSPRGTHWAALSLRASRWTYGAFYPHIILFTIFFLITYAQLRNVPKALMSSIAACIAMGFLIELAEGASRSHHCRMRDLIPDTVGALSGTAILVIWRRVRVLAYPSRHHVDL